MDDETAKIADPYKAREYWIQVARGAYDKGVLEKLPTRKAKTQREKETAYLQNYYLSRKSYGCFHKNYERIQWDDR